MKESDFYKTIIKSTGLFGTTQLVQMAFQIVTNKVVAILLGVSGIGMVGMFNNVLQLLCSLVGFDLHKLSTRSIALDQEINSQEQYKTIKQLNFVAISVGFLGGLVSVLFSGFWSRLAFNNEQYQHWFYFLGVYFFLWGFVQTRMGILQGTQQLKVFAYFQVFSAFSTGSISILLYYIYGIDAAFAVVISAILLQAVFLYWATKSYPFSFNFSLQQLPEQFNNTKPIYQLGLVLSANAIIGQLCFLGVRYFLKHQPQGFELVGLYEVNMTVLNKYLGLIFVAMNYYFYPKLTSLIQDSKKSQQLLMNQIETGVILVTPAIVLLYVFDEWFIQLLYSENFVLAFKILQFSLLGLFLKAITNALGFFALAKGDKRLFFGQELLGDVLNLIFSVLGYFYFGLQGLGLGIAVMYLFYGVYVGFFLNKKYQVYIDKSTLKIILLNGLICVLVVMISTFFYNVWLMSAVLLMTLFYNGFMLKKRLFN